MKESAQFELAPRHSDFKQVREQDAIGIHQHTDAFYAMLREREWRTWELPMTFGYLQDAQNKGRGTLDGGWLYETEKGVQAFVVLCRDMHNWSVATFYDGAEHDAARSRTITAEELPQLKDEIAAWFDMITQEVLPRERRRPYEVEMLSYITEISGVPKELGGEIVRTGHCFILKIQDIPVATVIAQANEKGYAVDFFRNDPDVMRPLERYWHNKGGR